MNNLNICKITEESKSPSQTLLPQIQQISYISGPYLPYKVVVHMATSCLTPFLQGAHDLAAPSDPRVVSETSCIHNLHALVVIFSGAAKANQIAEKLRYVNDITISTDLSDQIRWEYKILNLFAGEFLLKFRRNLPEEENTQETRNKTAYLYTQIIVGSFFKHTQPILEQCLSIKKESGEEPEQKIINNLKRSWKKLNYSFNKQMLLALRVDLHLNDRKTNEKSSFIYYITVLMPSSYEDSTKGKHRTYHAFLIEQFFHQGASYHRIYSSWAQSISLLEYFRERGYSETIEGCLTTAQMRDFMKDFELLVCESDATINRGAIRDRLFGGHVPFEQPPIVFFDDKSHVLKGLSLRYEACKIDPTDCLNHFKEFIESKYYKKQT